MKLTFILIIILLSNCQQPDKLTNSADNMAIASVIKKQQDDWNRGDIEAYMSGYWQSDSLRFASGGNFYYGWQRTLDRYKKSYPDRKAMGQLKFSVYDINLIGTDRAIVFGKWELKRETDNPNGLYTLLFQRIASEWKIVADHTSSAQ